MKLGRTVLSVLITVGVLSSNLSIVYAKDIAYKVQPGDSFYKIGQKYGIPTKLLMDFNNADSNAVLYPGQSLIIPEKVGSYVKYIVQKEDTYWTISQKFQLAFSKLLAYNNANVNSYLLIGQTVKIPLADTPNTAPNTSPAPALSPEPSPAATKPYITYTNYTVVKGDHFWSISEKFGITATELIKANNMTESTVLKVGQVLKVPVHHIPVKSTPGPKYGELLDWWTEAQYVLPNGTVFEVVDFYTGRSFFAKRTIGSNHADCEPLTLKDTIIMKEIWGGNFSWTRRPVIIKVNGRKLAGSISAMPHAGNDAAPGGQYTTWRSDGYGPGNNLDWVKNNGADGVFDLHFLNSTRHMDGKIDSNHQENIKIAAGQK